MSNRELPMMPWFPKEFAAATSTWSFAERSAYRALLDVQWEEGVLPDEPWRLASAIRMPIDEFEEVWPRVRRKFKKIDGELQNERLEEHRVKAFKKKQGHTAGAEKTNADRIAKRDAKQTAKHHAKRNGKRPGSDTPPSPSPSPSLREEHPLPPQGGGLGLTANGGRKPREERDRSLSAWREITPIIDDIASTGTLPPDQRRTWADVGRHCEDTAAVKAAESIGFRVIADRDKFTTTDLQTRFRDAYERIAAEAAH